MKRKMYVNRVKKRTFLLCTTVIILLGGRHWYSEMTQLQFGPRTALWLLHLVLSLY